MRAGFLFSSVWFVLVLACASPETSVNNKSCNSGVYTLSGDYPGSRLGRCHVRSARSFHLVNAPEDVPINHSPWYGFKIEGEPGQLRVSIRYTLHEHRYWPKYSTNGTSWRAVPAQWVKVSADKKMLRLRLLIKESPMWISAQENLNMDWYDTWLSIVTDKHSALTPRKIGKSIAGKPILSYQTDPQAEHVILLVGRQHPPEVTGALGMRFFVDRLLEGDSQHCENKLALCKFYQQHNIIFIPLLNPDGVAQGHWRHNLGHMDLNRDWGPFTQPETQAIEKLINNLVAEDKTIKLFLDFHSTQHNLFYTQADSELTKPANFATRWLELAASKGTYPFKQERRHNAGLPTSKNYMFSRFGIPSITYEVGDETDRVSIRDSARVFADAMITTMQSSP